MAKILAFAGSNSSVSINYKLVLHTVDMIKAHDVETMNLANYPFPMYSYDLEKEEGYSNSLIEFLNDIKKADGLIISVNEHNGNPSAYFKNVLDWLSRVERKFLTDKKILLMSTSGGKRGAQGSLGVIEALLPRFGAEIIETFSLPNFNDTFEVSKGITDNELAKEHLKALNQFLKSF